MRSSDLYQYALIALGVVSTLFFGAFFWREIFPEYKIYQDAYVSLEDFRSSYTGEPPPEFRNGIKQIVFEKDNKGPPDIDRCVSCHVALQIPDFSPTKIAYDINGKILLDGTGTPVKVENENYVWRRLDQKIAELSDPKVLEQLEKTGESAKIKERLRQAEQLKKLKKAAVGEHVYEMAKVLQMHPLIGKETRPFEFHPIEEYGCTVCHNGNGRGLTTDTAHGPVFDGHYEYEFIGPEPEFLEKDAANDPAFAHAYNEKPGHELLFQTTPLFIGSLIQSKCAQCHLTSQSSLSKALNSAGRLTDKREKQGALLKKALENETNAVVSLLKLRKSITEKGVAKTIEALERDAHNYTLPPSELEAYSNQLSNVKKIVGEDKKSPRAQEGLFTSIDQQLKNALGDDALVSAIIKNGNEKETNLNLVVEKFLVEHKNDPKAQGSIFVKYDALDFEAELLRHVEGVQSSYKNVLNDPQSMMALQSDVDLLTKHFKHGQELYFAQACYACHRISTFTRGGVGPELTRTGLNYPWFIKKKISWPQFDLKTSTMPNMHLDHTVVEDLMAFLMAQTGNSKAISDSDYKILVQEWEAGKKQPWEQPVPPSQIRNLDFSRTVFATEGCAACHKLKGYESDVGYTVEKEKEKVDFSTRYGETEWFTHLVPEDIIGSNLVAVLEQHSAEIDKRITNGVRKDAILEQIEKSHPGLIYTFNTPFLFASRAKNAYYADLADKEKDPVKKEKILKGLKEWQDRVYRVMMVYVQEYGLGRLVGPRPSYSGVFRSDEWLMEHFHKPTAHVANSIMPVFPFDDTKFYSLTYMLDALGKKNRDAVREVWEHKGFDPEQAYQFFCAQCHGEFRNGNGPVAQWIYPIPKNLRNADFLRNLTAERVRTSILHGVKGTPMPPWGEVAADKPTTVGGPLITPSEANQMTEWLFSTLPGGGIIKGVEDVPKWHYTPEDVIKELKREGNQLKPQKPAQGAFLDLPTGDYLYADLEPKVFLNENENAIFIKKEPPVAGGPDKEGFYIKKEYYTPENIEAGRHFFLLNCAVCHGTEGDGKGIRAEVMQDAKPRMLTNLDWLDTRDDLRLIRSIKYGVAGTAMTPWGDLTSSLQRLQLVIFIRTLSEEQEERVRLQNALYKAFDTSDIALEVARIDEYAAIDSTQNEITQLKRAQENLFKKALTEEAVQKDALSNYQKLLEAQKKLVLLQQKDEAIVSLKDEISNEKNFYQSIGTNLIVRSVSDKAYQDFLQMVYLSQDTYLYKEGKLLSFGDPKKEEKLQQLQDSILKEIAVKIDELENAKKDVAGKIATADSDKELARISADLVSYQGLNRKLISLFEEAKRARAKQKELYKQIIDSQGQK